MQLVALLQDLVEEAMSKNFTKCWCVKRITLCEWCSRKALYAPCAPDSHDPLRHCRHALASLANPDNNV